MISGIASLDCKGKRSIAFYFLIEFKNAFILVWHETESFSLLKG